MKPAELANAYLDALSGPEVEAVASFLHDGVVVELPMSLTGEPVPMFIFDGKDAAMEYLRSIATNFHHVAFTDRRTFSVDDDETVFVEAKGDLVQRGTNARYKNIYCFKLTVIDHQIVRISEYTNPIAWGKLMNLKLG